VFDPVTPLGQQHAVDYLIETLLSAEDDEITLVPTGPLTNIAHAIKKDPRILPKIREIVFMGGTCREPGDVTASAEYNVFFDPHAAKIVFECGRPIAAFGLDVTHQLLVTPDRLEKIQRIGSRAGDAAFGMLNFYGDTIAKFLKLPGAPLHDPCTIAYLLDPSMFEMQACNVSIETKGRLTMGHTAVDLFGVSRRPHNCLWAIGVDEEKFFELIISGLASLK